MRVKKAVTPLQSPEVNLVISTVFYDYLFFSRDSFSETYSADINLIPILSYYRILRRNYNNSLKSYSLAVMVYTSNYKSKFNKSIIALSTSLPVIFLGFADYFGGILLFLALFCEKR